MEGREIERRKLEEEALALVLRLNDMQIQRIMEFCTNSHHTPDCILVPK